MLLLLVFYCRSWWLFPVAWSQSQLLISLLSNIPPNRCPRTRWGLVLPMLESSLLVVWCACVVWYLASTVVDASAFVGRPLLVLWVILLTPLLRRRCLAVCRSSCSLPTALRKAACFSVDRGCSCSADAVDFRDAVPGAAAVLHVDMLLSASSLSM